MLLDVTPDGVVCPLDPNHPAVAVHELQKKLDGDSITNNPIYCLALEVLRIHASLQRVVKNINQLTAISNKLTDLCGTKARTWRLWPF